MTDPAAVLTPPELRRSVLIGLVGTGVAPSLTPPMHELEGARHGMHYVYRTIDLDAGAVEATDIGPLLDAACRLGFDGLNVTHPVKQTVLPLLDELAPSAAIVGAVNTIVFDGDRMIGHNTDVTGFGAALESALPDAPRRRVVLVGAGGAGSAIACALVARGVEDLAIVDVEPDRAEHLAASIRAVAAGAEDAIVVRAASQQDVPELMAAADGVVNATPFGMAAHPGTAFETSLLTGRVWVADVVYRPVTTALLSAARDLGCRTMSGLGMAMNQAADAFEIFTGEPADRTAMLADLEELVAAEAAGTFTPAVPRRGKNR